jgi:hypothetical protein
MFSEFSIDHAQDGVCELRGQKSMIEKEKGQEK